MPLARRLRQISALERREEARAFLDAFHDAGQIATSVRQRRWSEVRRQLMHSSFYEHTPDELAFGARLAWRNQGRCIGRLFWESLEVADCRHLTAPEAIMARMATHLDETLTDGRVRSIISIFAPVRGQHLPAWIESPQITQYACHVLPDGRHLGDRQNIEATRIALSMGWQPPEKPGRFDMLPYFVRSMDDRRHLGILPAGLAQEVSISHPTQEELSRLELKWHAVPLVSDMILSIGGIEYPCAPFNGFYMGTEIASRNFADIRRYDLLAEVARALDIDRTTDGLWQDRTLTELNRAVLHSYKAAGVTMVDHHTASDQFMTFHRREQLAGRRVAADWRWIVPPQASASCEVFHLKMRNFHPVPNFYRTRGGDGMQLMPWYGDRYRRRPAIWADRIKRRWKIWKRMAW